MATASLAPDLPALDSLVGFLVDVVWLGPDGAVSAAAHGRVHRVEPWGSGDQVLVALQDATDSDCAAVIATRAQLERARRDSAGRVVIDVAGGSVRLEPLPG